jgi:hypothetical protein
MQRVQLLQSCKHRHLVSGMTGVLRLLCSQVMAADGPSNGLPEGAHAQMRVNSVGTGAWPHTHAHTDARQNAEHVAAMLCS